MSPMVHRIGPSLSCASEPGLSVAFRPIFPGGAFRAGDPSMRLNDTAVEVTIRVLEENGDVFEEVEGFGMQF